MTTRRLEKGMTLIEMMIALLIGTILSVAVFLVMSTFEGRRRTLGSGADLDQNGSVAMFQLDQWIRGAGTGITQAVKRYSDGSTQPFAYGCKLFAAKSGTQILPRSTALPAPFDSVNPGASGEFRLAPVMILPGQTAPGASVNGTSTATSDVLITMASGSGNGQVPALFDNISATTATQLNLVNTMAFSASSSSGASTASSDLVLLADQSGAGGTTVPCLLTQISSTFSNPINAGPPVTAVTALPLAGTWYAATVGTQSVTSYPLNTGVAIDLGSPTSLRPPSFQVLGVGDNNTLFSYDLLNITGTPLQARAEGVFEMHALYGVGGSFYAADSSSTYSVSALSAGNSAAANLISGINAIRVGLIMRTALPEKDVVKGPSSLTLFSDLGSTLTFTRTLTTAEQHYRYRTIEATIPLRNSF